MANTLTIIGAGIAGLAAGCYAQMNGYKTRIYEMHTLPGGLCTAWKRQGYLIDGCIHWLCGSGPGVELHDTWEALGATQTLEYVEHRAQVHLELPDLKFTLYNDADEMEATMLAMAPEDAEWIREVAQAVRDFKRYGQGPESLSPAAVEYRAKWYSISLDQLVGRIQNPKLKQAMSILWGGGMPVFFGLLCLGFSNAKSAGYPIGGSLEFACAIERCYLALGGEIHYNAKVEKILTENGRAVGLRLADGSTVWEREGDIISAADAYATIFKMLDGQYADDAIRAWFEQGQVIGSPVQVTVGVAMDLSDAPTSTSGLLFVPEKPVNIYGQTLNLMNAEVFTFDPTSAPAGKAVVKVNLWGNYPFWKQLHETPAKYEAEKNRITREVIAALDCRFPGLAEHVEMIDMATPLTFERYTGNWQGSSQGWLPTPQLAGWAEESARDGRWPASKTLPGLEHFYMAGQWVEIFGGLPTAAISAQNLIEALCKRDGKEFRVSRT